MIELSIIVVSYNTEKLLEACLSSVENALKLSNLSSISEIILVDNASVDNSVKMVVKKFPKVQVIKNLKNKGFGAANNKGILRAKGEYILLLNSDTVVNPDALTESLSIIKNDQDIGVLGCKLYNRDYSIQQSCGYFPSLYRVFFWMLFIDDLPIIKKVVKPYHITDKTFYLRNDNTEVDWVTGAYFLARKNAILQAGLFDPKVFMYVEEIDLCYRMKQHGWKVVFTPKISISHKKGGSAKTKYSGIIEEFHGLNYFYDKYYPKVSRILLCFTLYIGALLRVLVFGIIKNSEKKHLYLEYLNLVR